MEKEMLMELGLSEKQAERVAVLAGQEIAQMKEALKEQAVLLALDHAGAKNPKVVKAAVDMEKVELNEKGELLGLEMQITALKKSDAYLFKTEEGADSGRYLSGVCHGSFLGGDMSAMSDAEYYAAVLSRR